MQDDTQKRVRECGTENLGLAPTEGGDDVGVPAIEAAPSETSAVETIGIGEVSDDPEEYGIRRPRCWQLVAALTIRDRPDELILREATLWHESRRREELPEALAQFMNECEETLAQPCWTNTGILRLHKDHRAELLDAIEHLRDGRTLGACDRVDRILRQPDDSISPHALAEALVEVSYLVPTKDGAFRKRPGLTGLEVLRFLNENDFPVILYPTEKQAYSVSSMEYHVVAGDLAAYEKDPSPGHIRYFVEVVRNRAGSESAMVHRCPRPPGVAGDIVWSVDKPSVLPERFRRPIIADGTYLEPYEFIGLRASAFAEDYEELAKSGLPSKVWADGRVVPPCDVLEGRLGDNVVSTSEDAAKGVSSL